MNGVSESFTVLPADITRTHTGRPGRALYGCLVVALPAAPVRSEFCVLASCKVPGVGGWVAGGGGVVVHVLNECRHLGGTLQVGLANTGCICRPPPQLPGC